MGKILDKVQDGIGAVLHDQARRTGISAERIDTSLKKKVPAEVLALQVNMNEQKNNPANPLEFTADEILAVAKFHQANKRRPAYTQQQAGALDRNQVEAESPAPAQAPASGLTA